MCGPSIGDEFTAGQRRTVAKPGFDLARRIERRKEVLGIPEFTAEETAAMESLERGRKVASGGRQATILAGGGVAREARRVSLLAASTAAEKQRKTLLGQ